jgi:hypothetical protein
MSVTTQDDPHDEVKSSSPSSGDPLPPGSPTNDQSPVSPSRTVRRKQVSEDLRKQYKGEEDPLPSLTSSTKE